MKSGFKSYSTFITGSKLAHIFLFVGLLLLISCNPATLSDARDQYVRGEYHAAGETYRKLYRNAPREDRAQRAIIAFEMAEANRKLNRSSRAAVAYRNAIRYEYPDTLMYLRYAQMLHREGEYMPAIEAYRVFLGFRPGDLLALNGIKGAEQAITWSKNPTRCAVNRTDLFNSGRGEFSPVLAHNDDMLYFSSSRDDATGEEKSPVTGMKYNDLFVSAKNVHGEWQKPEPLKSEINSEFDEGTPSITSDGKHLFYTFSYADPDRPTSTGIYLSRWINGTWTAGRLLKMVPNDSLHLFAHPAVSPSGRYLYFVSDMPGGYGAKDIWRARLSPSFEVISVENPGPAINSPGNEMFPYVKNDTTLYFSSDGHPGMGGLDLFVARRPVGSEQWQIENMQSPINSSADDFGITFERGAEKGFFSSNRNDVRGYDHIYSFEYPETAIMVEGFAVDQEDEFIAGATVSVVGSDGSQHRFITNKRGEYRFEAKRGTDYLFMASADGFLNQKHSLRTTSKEIDSLYYVDFEMIPYNKPVILENIFYDFDRATLRPESKEELDGLVDLMNEHPEINIELAAHTDCRGTEAYNLQLSLRRVESVVAYLVEHGIHKERLSAIGRGESEPKMITGNIASRYDFLTEGDVLTEEFIRKLPPEQQDIADQINRRTEFKVLD